MKRSFISLLTIFLLIICAHSILAEENIFQSGLFEYSLLPDGTAEITHYLGSSNDAFSVTNFSADSMNTVNQIVEIPETLDGYQVTSIGERAFWHCVEVKGIQLPNSVTKICDEAFAHCNVKEIELPDSISYVGDNPFHHTPLSTFIVSSNHPYLEIIDGVLFSKPDKRLICYPRTKGLEHYEIPFGTAIIGTRAFEGVSKVLVGVTIPDSVTAIGSYAFYFCEKLSSLTLPNSVTSIGNYSFSYCNSISSFTLPDSVSSTGANPFGGCENLYTFHISSSHPYLEVIDNILFSKPDNKLVCYLRTNESTVYSIPQGTLTIGEDAFANNKHIETVIIPPSVVSIEKSAFMGCYSLTEANLPASVTHIGDYAFSSCKLLKGVKLPQDLSYLGKHAFSGCESITDVQIPAGITEIGDQTFNWCKSLKNVILPDGIKIIGNLAFKNCDLLATIILPDSVEYIGEEAFSSPNITIAVNDNSYVVDYCIKNGINYKTSNSANGNDKTSSQSSTNSNSTTNEIKNSSNVRNLKVRHYGRIIGYGFRCGIAFLLIYLLGLIIFAFSKKSKLLKTFWFIGVALQIYITIRTFQINAEYALKHPELTVSILFFSLIPVICGFFLVRKLSKKSLKQTAEPAITSDEKDEQTVCPLAVNSKSQDIIKSPPEMKNAPKYLPGMEPDNIQHLIGSFFSEIDSTFPDKKIYWNEWNHARWDKAAGYLCNYLGYSRGKDFLEAYGYSIMEKGRG